MKAARIVVLGVALAAGGVAALLAGGHHEAAPPPPSAPPPPPLATVDVLVAKNDLSRGQVIGDGDVDWQTWPASSANANFIKRADRPDAVHQFVGAIVREPLVSGEPIRDPSVVFAKGSGFMAAILPKGRRAVSMEVSAENSAGGFILPDDHVDVVLTRHDKMQTAGGASDKLVSEAILRNIRVLAIDQAVEEKAGQKVVIGKTATLELTPDQAETLEMARQQGTLSLVLRSLIDSTSDTPEDDGDSAAKKPLPINTVRYGVSTVSTPR
jgi:pilus assembly protein CpaB